MTNLFPVPVNVVTLLEKSDWNMLDDEWTWYAYLRRRKDGRFTLSFRQETKHPIGVYRPTGLVGFKGAAALYQFLGAMWSEHTGDDLDELTYDKIAEIIDSLDRRVADELRKILRDERNPPPPPPPSPVALHVARARWSQEGFGGAGGLNAAFQGALRRRAAAFYADRYLKRNGTLPEGEHVVEVSVGSIASGADVEPPMRTSTSQLKVVITYPQVISVPSEVGVASDIHEVAADSDPELLRVSRVLRGEVNWNQKHFKTLRSLHEKAESETPAPARNSGSAAALVSWRSLERRLFGDLDNCLEDNEQYGRGFGASLIDGPSIDIFRLAGLELTDELTDNLWNNVNWQSLLDACQSATVIETSETEGGPGMSDTFYWVAVDNPERFGRELREVILIYAFRK